MPKRRSSQPNDREILTAEQVAEMLGIAVDKARILMADGSIKSQKPGTRWLTSRAAVLNYVGGLK